MRSATTLLDKLACPECAAAGTRGSALTPRGADGGASLCCLRCGAAFRFRDGVPDFVGETPDPRRFSTQWAMQFGPLVSVYERIWRPLVTLPFSGPLWEAHTVLRYLDLSPGVQVLDLACGPGNFSRRIARACRPGVVVGADLSWPMLQRGVRDLADGRHGNVTLMRVDVTRWPYAAGSFDRVHCAGALHLFPAIDRVFASIHDTLRPGGLFVGATYCRGGGVVKERLQRHVSDVHGFHWFEPGELQALAADAGFTEWQQAVYRQGIVFRVRRPDA